MDSKTAGPDALSLLQAQILERGREIKTDGYPMSIGEVLNMYRDGDLDVHPEFQRIYRWSQTQKSRLIESILLSIPVPTVFVAQRDDGVWDVIDGVQRLSTIFEFVGIYRGPDGTLLPPLTLEGTEYLPTLADFTYEVDGGNGKVFDNGLRRDFKRAKLDFRIVQKESDSQAKYDLFQRLNSGTQLSPQEARNCVLVMINPPFFEWVAEVTKNKDFTATTSLTERKEDQGFRQELVIRFLLQAEYSEGTQPLRTELSEYITDWVKKRASELQPSSAIGQFDEWRSKFERTFRILNTALRDNAFRRYDKRTSRFLGPFSISAFEAITSGVSHNIALWESAIDSAQTLRNQVADMWSDSRFQENSGSGINARLRAPRLIHFGREYYQPR